MPALTKRVGLSVNTFRLLVIDIPTSLHCKVILIQLSASIIIQRLVIGNLLHIMFFGCGLSCPMVSRVMSASMGKVFAVPDVPNPY